MNIRVADASPDQEDVREGLQRQVTQRWIKTATEVRRAILLHDALGIGDKAPQLAQPTADKAAMFQRWLDERLMAGVAGYDGSWLEPFVRGASSRGALRVAMGDAAQANLGFMLPGAAPSAKACHGATVSSLAGICEDVSAKAHASVAGGLLSRARPRRIARMVDQAMGHGLKRTRALAEHAVTQAYSQATLDALEARGVTHVGTVSERHRRLRDFDPDEARDPFGRWAAVASASPEEWSGLTAEGKETLTKRLLPAVRKGGLTIVGHRGQTHRDLGYEVENPAGKERGFYDPLSAKFHSGVNVPLDSSDLMTPVQRMRVFGRDFDPDEPRDPYGKWTTGGAGPAGPYLVPTILWKGKKYYGASHAAAAHSDPQLLKELSKVDWGDDSVIRYTTPEGELLNRHEARAYAQENDLLGRDVFNQPDLISEQLTPEAADPVHLRFRKASSLLERGFTAVSPSTHDKDFAAAAAALSGEKQRRFEAASAEVDQGLGLEAKDVGVVGAWKDGAENALATITQHADWDALKLSAAMKAHLSDQKAALVFKQGEGDAVLYSFRAKGDLAAIHAGLLEDGVAFHSLAPEADGATVYVADLDGSAYHAVAKAAGRFDAKVDYQFGRGEFIGAEGEGTDRQQRDDARRAYEEIIGQSTVSGSADLWGRVHARWGKTLQALDAYDPDEPRDPAGRWTAELAEFSEGVRRDLGVYMTVKPATLHSGWYLSEMSRGAGAPKGAGTEALRRLGELADKHHKDVSVAPVATDARERQGDLERFYRKGGFEYEDEPGIWIRRASAGEDPASRLARAKEQGFTLAAYHGSSTGDIESFEVRQPALGAAGVYLATDPEHAGAFAHAEIPKDPTKPTPSVGGSIYPVLVRGKIAPRSYVEPLYAEYPGPDGMRQMVERLKSEGYAGFYEDRQHSGFVVFDPKNVRSRFAEFHPDKTESARLLDEWFKDDARINPQPQHPRTGRFAKAHVVARETRRSKRTGQFRRQGLSPEEQRLEELREARFGRLRGRLDVQTQGDDRVCDECDAISDNGPYTINKARSLIPAHYGCRCVFVAAGTMRDALLDFDPDEPRDERGRWSEGGGSHAEGVAAAAASGGDPMAKAAWVLEKAKNAVAEAGYDPERVFLSLKPPKFKVGDREYTTGGEAFVSGSSGVRWIDGGGNPRQKGDIVIYGEPDFSKDFPVRGIAVHEAMHQKWQAVVDAAAAESPVQDQTTGKWHPGPIDSMVKQYFGSSALETEDGVSEYSKSYWDAYHHQQGEYGRAVHETLAELARLEEEQPKGKERGSLTSTLNSKPVAPVWMNFYNAVNQLWDQYVKPKKPADAPAH